MISNIYRKQKLSIFLVVDNKEVILATIKNAFVDPKISGITGNVFDNGFMLRLYNVTSKEMISVFKYTFLRTEKGLLLVPKTRMHLIPKMTLYILIGMPLLLLLQEPKLNTPFSTLLLICIGYGFLSIPFLLLFISYVSSYNLTQNKVKEILTNVIIKEIS